MGWIGALLTGGDNGRLPEERAVDVIQHRAWRLAGNQAANALRGDGGMLVHDQLNEAVIEAEADVPWWRR